MTPGSASACDIFALGHAVVDVEFEVSPDLLSSLGFEPGARYLIDEGQFQILHAALQAPGAEARWIAQTGGGSAANAIVTAQRLGAQCHFAGKLARDAAGWFYQQTLQNEGVQVPDTPLADGISGHCLVLVTPDAERTMVLYLGVTTELESSYVDLNALGQAGCLYLESYLVTDPVARDTVGHALDTAARQKLPVIVSLSDAGIIQQWRDNLQRWFQPPVDLLLCNESEALAWADTADLGGALHTLLQLAHKVVVTRGASGALVADATSHTELTAPSVQAVSALGAGDTFAGAVLFGHYQQHWPLPRAAEFAIRCAARKVEFNGPRLAREQLIWVYSQFLNSDNENTG